MASPNFPRDSGHGQDGWALARERAARRQKLAVVYVRQSTDEQVRENQGSTNDQRALALVARQLNYPLPRILILEDLGESGTSADRPQFQKLLSLIKDDKVDIVLTRDMARLSRNRLHAEQLLETARRHRVLIYTNGRIVDPSGSSGDRLTARVQADIAAYDNENRVEMQQRSRAAKARLGHAVTRPPIGYVQEVRDHRVDRGRWVKDPDPDVQTAVERLFKLAQELGSGHKVWKFHRDNNLLFPRRDRGELRWEPLRRSHLFHILTNPNYTDSYVYGRFTRTTETGDRVAGMRRSAKSDQIVSEHHHAPYVTREAFQRIQAALERRRLAVSPVLGKGPALLQGLAACPNHGRMRTQYWRTRRHRYEPSYVCWWRTPWGDARTHQQCRARTVDETVIEMVLSTLATAEVETVAAVVEAADAADRAARREQAQRLEEAERKVAETRRRYDTVDPEHHLVHREREAEYQRALRERDAIQQVTAHPTVEPTTALTAGEVTTLVALAKTVRDLWAAPQTTDADRKRLLRALLSRVVIVADTDEAVELEVEWTGGHRQRLRVLRPHGVDELVRDLRAQGKDADAIARELRARGITSAYGAPITRRVVFDSLKRLGMNRKADRVKALLLIRQMFLDTVQRREMLARLATEAPTSLGPWTYERLVDALRSLRRGVPGVPPLPEILPFERDKTMVMEFILRRGGERSSWRAIAEELNALGLRPQKAPTFTVSQVVGLFQGWRRRQAKLSPIEETSHEI